MGTNYYLRDGTTVDARHIGKSSGGWCFALRAYPEEGIMNLNDWKELWTADAHIFDEYGHSLSVKEMVDIITERKRETPLPDIIPGIASLNIPQQTREQFLASNHATSGPNNLMRSVLDGRHCIGHGKGTWDIISGEFC